MSDKLRDAADYAIRRLQSDIDSGSRPDQWSMEDIVRGLRSALAGGDAARGTMPNLPAPSHCGPGGTGNYFDSYTADQMRAYGEACWQAATRAAAPQVVEMSDERIDAIADLVVKGMPEGIRGFLRAWGWRQFARALLADCWGHVAAAPHQPRYRCAACSAPLKAGYACACGSDKAEQVEAAAPQSAEPAADAQWVEEGIAIADGLLMAGDADEMARQRAALRAHLSTRAAAPQDLDIYLDEDAAARLRDAIGLALEDGEASPIRIQSGDGHSGPGLYISLAEYPEEGSIKLWDWPIAAAPQSAEPVAWLAYDGARQLFIVGGNGPHDLYGGFPVYLAAPTEADRLDAGPAVYWPEFPPFPTWISANDLHSLQEWAQTVRRDAFAAGMQRAARKAPTEADRLDAERYRWLRDSVDSCWAICEWLDDDVDGIGFYRDARAAHITDSAIDAAMSAQAGGKEQGS